MDWLDTETKEILQKTQEPKQTLSKVAEFALVMIHKGVDSRRLVRAICRINECGTAKALELAHQPSPLVLNPDLTHAEAVLGQFELICCDAPSAILRSEVALQGDKAYLQETLMKIWRSPEFRVVTLQLDDIPVNNAGEKFVDQFLGMTLEQLLKLGFPRRFGMPAKKARIMKHWAARIGAQAQEKLIR